jgi:endonuclease YncB( thermonuclease family)
VVRHRMVGVCALAIMVAGAARADDKAACSPDVIGSATVQSVIDGRTVTLDDGRELRLPGIEVPENDGNAAAARAALEKRVARQEVLLLQMGPASDRYGRLTAGLTLADNENPVQLELLADGLALSASTAANTGCSVAFLNAEKAARVAGFGLWKTAYYTKTNAEDPSGVLAFRGHFAVVEGKVLSVRESGSVVYVNFGRRWSEDFTVTTLKRNERTFEAAGLPLKKLAGRRIRVRGTVEERGGPWIEVIHPGQIEIVEQP